MDHAYADYRKVDIDLQCTATTNVHHARRPFGVLTPSTPQLLPQQEALVLYTRKLKNKTPVLAGSAPSFSRIDHAPTINITILTLEFKLKCPSTMFLLRAQRGADDSPSNSIERRK